MTHKWEQKTQFKCSERRPRLLGSVSSTDESTDARSGTFHFIPQFFELSNKKWVTNLNLILLRLQCVTVTSKLKNLTGSWLVFWKEAGTRPLLVSFWLSSRQTWSLYVADVSDFQERAPIQQQNSKTQRQQGNRPQAAPQEAAAQAVCVLMTNMLM